jgi:hypothetical protein
MECSFKIVMEAKHEGGHYLKVKYDWLANDPNDHNLQKLDTGFFRDWNVLQIEGEEPKPPEPVVSLDPKAAAAAKKAPAPAGKADPKKAGGALEEITDNRPRTITLTKDFAAEAGGLGLKVNEDLAKRIAETFIKIDVFEVNRETQEETLKDSVTIDISCILYPATPNLEFSWTFDKLKLMQLHYLTFKIQSD